MKKIMFNDKYGLTKAVLAGRKTQTRRIVSLPGGLTHDDICNPVMGIDDKGRVYFTFYIGCRPHDIYPAYQIGEGVAVAQRYWELRNCNAFYDALDRADPSFPLECIEGEKGCYNKMFVKADWMPHRIRITNIKVERLQDISDEDCQREGIVPITWRQWLEQDINDLSPQKYKDLDVWTLPKFIDGISDPWEDSDPDEYMADKPHTAFAVLIFKLMGRKTWERNPWVFAYEFELIH